jgi:hypothetical protein
LQSSRVLAAPGIRTAVYPGWRARLGTAFGAVIEQPTLWLFGVLGFSLRGGIVVLTLPIIVMPTPVEARLLLGDYLGTTGFSERFWAESAVIAFVGAAVIILVLTALARLEVAGFTRLAIVDEGSASGLASAAFLPVLGVHFVGFIATLVAAAPLTKAAIETSYAEVVRPTSPAPIFDRVVGTLGAELLLFAAAIVVIEIVSALTTREILVRLLRSAPRGQPFVLFVRALGAALRRLVRSPLRVIATALLGWLITAALLVPALGAIVLAWAGTRASFLSSVSLADLGDDLGMVLMAFGLAATFAVAMTLAGFASALRAATWSVDRLR